MFSFRFRSLELLYSITASTICQELFSKFFDFRLSIFDFRFSTFDFRLSTFDFRLLTFAVIVAFATAFEFYHTQNRLSSSFFALFQTFSSLFFNSFAARSNFYSLSWRFSFVKNFFHFFSISIRRDPGSRRPRRQLAYTNTALTVCQAQKPSF